MGSPTSHHGTAQGPSRRLNLLLSHGGWQDESWADQLPRLLEPMGVRSLRVGSARAATQMIHQEPVHIAVVDLALPLEECPACPTEASQASTEEGGRRVLELLSRLSDSPPIVVVNRRRPDRERSRELAAALHHGAFAALDAPVSIEAVLRVMERILEKCYAGRWPGRPNN